jgi:RNA polymerase sigma-70 factor (ECF subfamily)
MNFNPADIRIMLYAATRRTGTPVRDEDLEQDIALHAVCAFRRLGQVSHPRALLMKIVHDAVRDHWRRRQSFTTLDSIEERFIAKRPEFECEIDLRRRLALLERAMNSLPPHRRHLIDLFYNHDHSVTEIAAIHGKSVSAIKMELRRSRVALARIVRRMTTKKSQQPR